MNNKEIENIFILIVIVLNFSLIVLFNKIKLFHINLDTPDGKENYMENPYHWLVE